MKAQFRLKNHVLAIALAAAYPAVSYAAGAARLEFVSGNVVAITSAGLQRELSRGSELLAGEAIRTGDNAHAQLRFSDGAMMSLQPQTEFRIDEYRYSGKVDGEERGFFSLIKGGLRTITGLIGKGQRDNYRVNTAVATIGIRGTEYAATFTGGQDGTLNTTTNEGAIAVCGLSGNCFTAPSGQSVTVQGANDPKPNNERPFLPAPGMPQQGSAAGGAGNSGAGAADPNAGMNATSPANDRTANGGYEALPGTGGKSNVIGPPLTTGAGYTMAYAVGSYGLSTTSGIATFGDESKLLSVGTAPYLTEASIVKEAYSLDGVIGWGAWDTGSYYGSQLGDGVLHYIVGKPTAGAELGALAGVTATYSMVGYTQPTTAQGGVGSNVTASLTINFNTSNTATFGVGYTMNGTNYSGSASGTFGATNSSFNITGGGLTAQGVLIGTNAAYAGVVYEHVNGTDAVNGAVAFVKQ